ALRQTAEARTRELQAAQRRVRSLGNEKDALQADLMDQLRIKDERIREQGSQIRDLERDNRTTRKENVDLGAEVRAVTARLALREKRLDFLENQLERVKKEKSALLEELGKPRTPRPAHKPLWIPKPRR